MIRTLNLARRTSVTVAMAGAVAFGAVALAPAASAATAATADSVDGGYEIVEKVNGKGPVAFLIDANGNKKPIFFCEAGKPNKRHDNCQPDPESGDGRF